MQDFVELIFLKFPYCGILSTFYVVGFCPVGFCLKVWDFVRTVGFCPGFAKAINFHRRVGRLWWVLIFKNLGMIEQNR